MSRYGIKVRSGGVELLDTNRMGCVFALDGNTHNSEHGRYSQVDFPLATSFGARGVFGNYTTAAVVAAFDNGYGAVNRGSGGGGLIGLHGAAESRYMDLVAGAAVEQKIVNSGRHILSSTHTVVGCSNNINGASNYEEIAKSLPRSDYGLVVRNSLIHLATSVKSYRLININEYTTSMIKRFRSYTDPWQVHFSDSGNEKERLRAKMREYTSLAKDASVVSIPCSADEILAIKSLTHGAVVALFHKSPSHEVYICVSPSPVRLRVYRYSKSASPVIAQELFSSYAIQVKGTVSTFDSRQPLMLPLWVSFSAADIDTIPATYKTAVVFSNIRNFATARDMLHLGDHMRTQAKSTLILPAVSWVDDYRLNHNFVNLLNSGSFPKSGYEHDNGSFAGMISDISYNLEVIRRGNAEFDRTSYVFDPTFSRRRDIFLKNWNEINNMGAYMGVIAY